MSILWEASREAMFKQVNGGFIFREPGLFAHHYFVTDAQKAAIKGLLQPGKPFIVETFILAMVGPFALYVLSLTQRAWGIWVGGLVGSLVVVGIFWLVWRREISKKIAPALVGATYTAQRITWRERTETLARMLPISKAIGAGVAFLAGSVAFALFLVVPNDQAFWPPVVVCAIAAGYCFYLAALKGLDGRKKLQL